ncbi:MAG: hypothetical protein ACRD63_04810, partial [Pyrinomonadaceae bacterium]
LGIRLRFVRLFDLSPQNFNGTTVFAGGDGPSELNTEEPTASTPGQSILLTSIERFRRTTLLQQQGLPPAEIRRLGGGVTQFSVVTGTPEARVSLYDFGGFIQDDWKVSSSFSLGLGLRYERQSDVNSDYNFAPRVAFAWAFDRNNKKRGATVLRSGFGLFYSRLNQDLFLQADRFNGLNLEQFIVSDPLILDSFVGQPTAEELIQLGQPQTVRRIGADIRAPYTMQFAVTLERPLWHGTVLTMTYSQLRSLHTLRSRSIPDSPDRIYQYDTDGFFNQRRLGFTISTRLGRRFSLSANYDIGEAKSDTDGADSFPANPRDLQEDYSASALDARHRFSLNGSFSLPYSINVTPLVIIVSGTPFNITTGQDTNGDSIFNERPAFASDLSRPSVMVTSFGAFDRDPLPGMQPIPRNSGRAPVYATGSLRVSKVFRFNWPATKRAAHIPTQNPTTAAAKTAEKRFALNLSMQMWNLFNHANVGKPLGNLSSPLFGKSITIAGSYGAGDPLSGSRVIEVQARINF